MNIKLKLFLFSILISVSSLSFAIDNGTWTYDINSDGTSITLTGCSGSCPKDLTIPAIIDGYSTTIIGTYAFVDLQLTSVSIPDSVTIIDEKAFWNNELSKVIIPESVISIGASAFSDNALTLVRFKGDRPTLSRSTSFSGNPNLSKINFCSLNNGWVGDAISNGTDAILPEHNRLACPLNPNLNIDINCDNQYDALTDGLIIMRHIAGITGQALVSNTSAGYCSDRGNNTTQDLENYLSQIAPYFDIDLNGDENGNDPMDAFVIMRYLFGLRGDQLVNLGLRGPITDAEEIEEYISTELMPILAGDITTPSNLAEQTVTGTLSQRKIYSGASTELTVRHSADEDAQLAGLGLRLHFNSSQVDVGIAENLLPYVYPFQILNDSNNFDGDPNTDKYLLTSWAKEYGQGWLYDQFNIADLYKVNITAKNSFQGTTLKFTSSSTTFGYGLTGNPIYIGLSPDGDEDGVDDVSDNCPAISNPDQIDTDGDDIGNLCDTDDDNDTVLDGDDAFPLDATETVDTDSDGTGNNADTDDDGDGVADTQDAFPLDSTETIDTDSDGTGNNADTDDDGDGVADGSDAFPLDSTETTDTDSDGTGNNADTDDDGDGVADSSDAFPLDPTESIDTDLDGIGNNADNDDDGDGVLDSVDLYPLDASKTNEQLLDIDGNGKVDALTDGLVILRYVFGLRGDVLIGGVVASDATRTSAEEIEAYLATLMPSL